jgi:hypothetical protein
MLSVQAPPTPRAAVAASRVPVVGQVVVCVVATALAVPYLLMGPGWFREDFEPLRRARLQGWWDAAGPIVSRNRPVTSALYALVFGGLGDHPVLGYAVLTTLGVATLLLLLRLTAQHLGGRIGLAVTLVYALSPNRSSMTHWVSTVHIWLALLCLLGGLLLVARRAPWWATAALLGIGTLTYTAIVPLAAAGLVWEARRASSTTRRRELVLVGAVLATTFAYGYATAPDRPFELIALRGLLGGQFGWGLTSFGPVGTALPIVVLAASAVMAHRLVRLRHDPGCDLLPERMVVGGVVVVVLGTLPFLGMGADIDFVTQGDRVHCVSGIGGALVLTGIGLRAVRAVAGAVTVRPAAARASSVARATGCAVVAVAVLLVVGARLESDAAWASTWDDTRTAIDRGGAQVEAGSPVAEVGPCPISRGGVEGLNNDWDSTLALQWATRSPGVSATCHAPGG